ncbi:MAG: helix-turn-helix domain-containing protein [Oscillospiraceae bacterium]|nr:helix-turn-helix domain-containing protein [Oscillospiraceae bacterium]
MRNFGETIKKLRRQKDMTQEQLAEHLNISPQAISRWEINSTLPDITLIPILANIFDVTSDMLLGIDIDAKEKRIQEILSEAWEHFTKGNDEKEIETLRAGLKEFPNSHQIMNQLLHTGIESSEIIKIGEKILAECKQDTAQYTQDTIRHNAVRALCIAYAKVGELEKAKNLSCRMPFITECYEFIMESIGTKQEKAHQMRDNIFMLMDFMSLKLADLVSPPEDFDNLYAPQEKITILEKTIAMNKCLIEDGHYGIFGVRTAWAYVDIGKIYAEIGNFNDALENLRCAAEHFITMDRECVPGGDNYDPDREYTSLLLRGMKYSHVAPLGMAGNFSMQMHNCLSRDSFDPMRGNADFIEIEERLKKYATKS